MLFGPLQFTSQRGPRHSVGSFNSSGSSPIPLGLDIDQPIFVYILLDPEPWSYPSPRFRTP